MKSLFIFMAFIALLGFLWADPQVYLGMYISKLPTVELKALGLDYGLRVDSVLEDSPAGRAGLRKGQFVLSFNNKKLKSEEQLLDILEDCKPREVATLTVLSKGTTINKRVILQSKKELYQKLYTDNYEKNPFRYLGIRVQEMRGQLATFFGVKYGLLIVEVAPHSVANHCGFYAGDVILLANRKKVTHLETLLEQWQNQSVGSMFSMSVLRDGKVLDKKVQINSIAKSNSITDNRMYIFGPDIYDEEISKHLQKNPFPNTPRNKQDMINELEKLQHEVNQLKKQVSGK